MKSEKAAPKKKRKSKPRLFPWRCPSCLKGEVNPVVIPYTCKVNHDGNHYEIEVPKLKIPKCSACGELFFTYKTDDQITGVLLAKLNLLTPQEIRKKRRELGLSRKQLAERIGTTATEISSWEDKLRIQSRAIDNLLRVFFAFPEVRSALAGAKQDPNLGIDGDARSTLGKSKNLPRK